MGRRKFSIFLGTFLLCFAMFSVSAHAAVGESAPVDAYTPVGAPAPIGAHASVDTSRIYDEDIYKTSVNISKSNWNYSESVVLVSDEDGMGSLFAPVFSKYYNAPVLFTESGTLNAETEKEILRLNAKDVYVLGTQSEISDFVVKKLESDRLCAVRIGSSDISEMSVLVADHVADKFGTGKKAIIASADIPQDIISACIMGSERRMPVLLVKKNVMPKSVKKFIADRKINMLYVIGGNDIIDDSVAAPYTSERIFGNDSCQRSIMLYKKFERYFNFRNMYIAPVNNLYYAAAGSSVAVNSNSPMVLLNRTSEDALVNFIQTEMPDISRITAVGPEAEIPDVMLEEIASVSSYNAGILSQKDFSDLESYILKSSSIKCDDGSLINLDKVTAGEKNDDSDTVYVYIDMYSDSFIKYMQSQKARDGIEEMLNSVEKAVEERYAGRIISCELWYVRNFDDYPSSYLADEIEYNPSTAKWDVMIKKADILKSTESEQPVFTWNN